MKAIDVLYKVRFSEADRARKDEIWKVLCENFFQRYVDESDCVLDRASGYGEFTNHIQAKHKIAIDLNPDATECLNSDVKFYLTSADNMSDIDSGSVDVCFSSNFFEHLPSREVMDAVLDEAYRVLKPGGLYVSMQPNIHYAANAYWDYYDHILPLSHLSCKEAFEKAGYSVVSMIPRFVPFSTASKLPTNPLFVKLYLALPFVWHFLGKQFVIVAQKPS